MTRESDATTLVGTGSQRALRVANTNRVVQVLRDVGPLTQAQLARRTGLSTATVSNLVKVLARSGSVTTTPTTSRGRRALLVSLSDKPGDEVVAGVDIGRRHIRVVIAGLGREVLAEGVRGLRAPLPSAEEYLAEVVTLFEEVIADSGVDRTRVVACGVGIPGPIDMRSGRIAHGVILPEWVGYSLRELLARRLNMPVAVDNDANLGALAEVTWGPHNHVQNLVFVKVATGIGAGIVIRGEVYRGHIGITGEIGHMVVSEHGPVCRCGNRGCLETVSSVETMLSHMRKAHPERPFAEVSDFVDAVLREDPPALRVLEDGGLALGRTLGELANLLNPQVIVLGGPLLPVGEQLLATTRRGLDRLAAPVVSASTTLTVSTLGDRAEALGACSLALSQVPAAAWTSAAEQTR